MNIRGYKTYGVKIALQLIFRIRCDDGDVDDLSMCEQPRRDKGHGAVTTVKTSIFVTNNTIQYTTTQQKQETIRGNNNRVITRTMKGTVRDDVCSCVPFRWFDHFDPLSRNNVSIVL